MVQSANRLSRRGRYPAFLYTKLDVATLLKFEIAALIFLQFFTNAGLMPSAIVYCLDVVNVLLFVFGLRKVANELSSYHGYAILLMCYVVFAIITGVGSLTSPLCIGWELLQQLRIPLFVVLALTYWTYEDVDDVLRFLFRLQPLNLAFAFVEYFLLHLTDDSCGGLFGIAAGSNMMLNIYLVVVCVFACSSFLGSEKRISLLSLVITLLSSFFVASLAEIKFFYFEAAIILALSFLVGRKSLKAFVLVAVFIAAFAVGLVALAAYFPDSYEMLFDMNELVAYDSGENVATSGYGISRSAPIPQLDSLFFGTGDPIDKLVGLGFGSTTMSSIPQFCSPFYFIYGWLKYYYSPIAMLYLQNGYLGLVFYLLILLYPIGVALRRYSRISERPWVFVFSIGAGAMIAINLFYNGGARSYAAIMWAVCLVLPMICGKGALKNR